VAKQSYALPARPDLNGPVMSSPQGMSGGSQPIMNGSSQPQTVPAAEPEAQDISPVSNATLQSNNAMGAPVQSSGFLGAPQPLPSGVLESSEPAASPPVAAAPVAAAPVAASAAASPRQPAASQSASSLSGYVVQVSAINDAARARQLVNSLRQRFGVPGAVENAGNVYRVQLGGYKTRAEAVALQQRLSSEGQSAAFVTTAGR